MTALNFKRYCQRNKLLKIVPGEYSIDFIFEKGKRIVAHNGIDGITYSIWKKPKRNATKTLFTQLNSIAPDAMKRLTEKYKDANFDLVLKNNK